MSVEVRGSFVVIRWRDVVVGHELAVLKGDAAATLEVVVGGVHVAMRRGVEFYLNAADAP